MALHGPRCALQRSRQGAHHAQHTPLHVAAVSTVAVGWRVEA